MTHPLYNNSGLQKNNKSHVLYALADKQMELKKTEIEYEAKIKKIKTDLIALETTICLFDEDGEITIKKLNIKSNKSISTTRNSYFKRGEPKSIILRILRESDTSLTTEEVTRKCIIIQELDSEDKDLYIRIGKTVIMTLRKLESANLIELDNFVYKGRLLSWMIKDSVD